MGGPKCATEVLYDRGWMIYPNLQDSRMYGYRGRVIFRVLGRLFQCRWSRMPGPTQLAEFSLDVFDSGWIAVLDEFKSEGFPSIEHRSVVHDWIDAHVPLAVQILDGD